MTNDEESRFNPQQRDAIKAKGENYLISAGAGSGKTQVLTTRIKEIIKSGDAKVDELLVLTFTNKAAAEMKSRTRQALLEEMPEAAEQVETSDITTFDAFFLKLVKKYAYTLGLDPELNIANDVFLDVFKTETIKRLLLEKFSNADQTTSEMIHQYTIKTDENIVKYINDILDGASLVSDVDIYFESFKTDYFTNEYFDKRKQEYYKKCNDSFKAAFELVSVGNTNTLASDRNHYACFLNLGSYENIFDRFVLEDEAKERGEKSLTVNGLQYTFKFATASKKDPLSEEESVRRAVARSLFDGVKNSVKAYGDPKRQIEKIRSTQPYVSVLVDIAKEVYEELKKYKKEKNVYSFSDVASYARMLLNNQEILDKVIKQYKFIMIDEYQDTSDLQEEFISRIVNDNLFVVGDIKQSIYRFRNANPDIFSEKLKNYSNGNGGKVICLQTNYRSRKEVIDCINSLFERIMSPAIGDVDYTQGQSLAFGNDGLYGKEDKPEYKTKILQYEKPAGVNTDEAEAKIIAKDIINKVKSGFVLDVKGEGNRPCTWKDFAILIPNKGQFDTYKRIFKDAKIPLVATIDADFSDDNINLLFMSLLKMPMVVDADEVATKHCYASIKRSYLFQEDDDQLIDELISGEYQNDKLVKDMKDDKKTILNMGVYDATMFLIEKYQLIDKLLVVGDVKDNFEKINHLINLASEADKMGLDYKSYVEHFENLKKFKISDKIAINPGAGDQVKLMSIHASKGLEFPVVYCPNNARRFNNDDTKGCYLTAKDFGLLLPLNRTDEISKNFLYDLFKEEETTKGLSEYMRLFYVSLTRASDQIIFVLPKGKEEDFYKFYVHSVGKSYLGKKGLKLNNKTGNLDPDYKTLSIASFASFLHLAGDNFVNSHFAIEEVAVEDSQNDKEVLSNEVFTAPEMKSVSFEPVIVETHRASKDSLLPADEKSLERGTRLHRLLEVTDFRTKDTSFIENKEDKELIDKVLSLPVFDNLEKYKIFKEYSYFDEIENVNGIIDLLLVEKGGEAIIVDYKTSNIDDEAYKAQLQTYKKYVDRVFKTNSKTILLSIMKVKFKVVE